MLSPPESYTEVYKQIFYRGGYLFLQSIYYQMQMNKICRKLKQRYKFKYDINAILSDLIYARILEPYSKRSSYKATSEFLEKPNYSNQKKNRKNPNDPARFIGKMAITKEGGTADIKQYLNEDKIAEEVLYDKLYAVCTDLLDDEVGDILKVK